MQGDEPLIEPRADRRAGGTAARGRRAADGHAQGAAGRPEDRFEPNRAKLVVDARERALTFTRLPIVDDVPAGPRLLQPRGSWSARTRGGPLTVWSHVGVYAYRRDFLLGLRAPAADALRAGRAPRAAARARERLRDQRAHRASTAALQVDTPEDVLARRAALRARSEAKAERRTGTGPFTNRRFCRNSEQTCEEVPSLKRQSKFIFVTGGVLSSLGKGLSSASIGALLEARGLRVSFLKLDPYLNVDPGTMNPFQHGEVYVTADGAETDLDLGHYERFTSVNVGRRNNLTAGPGLRARDPEGARRRVPRRHGPGDPARHRRDQAAHPRAYPRRPTCCSSRSAAPSATSSRCRSSKPSASSAPTSGRENALYLHIALVPYVASAGELKTKPVQHSVKELRSIGIAPDIVLCRTDRYLPRSAKSKIALFCDVDEEAVITAKDVDSTIYELPLVLHAEGLDDQIVHAPEHLDRPAGPRALEARGRRCCAIPTGRVKIAMVGKYVDLTESYKSLNEALTHAGIAHEVAVEIEYVDSDKLEGAALDVLGRCRRHPGAARLRRARRRGQDRRDPVRARAPHSVLRHLLRPADRGDRDRAQPGGPRGRELDRDRPEDPAPGDRPDARAARSAARPAARCGSARSRARSRPTRWRARAYGRSEVSERHRHRYEVSPTYREQLEAHGPGALRDCRPTGAWSRSSSSPTTPGSSAASSIPSSSRTPSSRTRCSAPSSARPRAAARIDLRRALDLGCSDRVNLSGLGA